MTEFVRFLFNNIWYDYYFKCPDISINILFNYFYDLFLFILFWDYTW